jgi:hypothetical protein
MPSPRVAILAPAFFNSNGQFLPSGGSRTLQVFSLGCSAGLQWRFSAVQLPSRALCF